MKQSLGLWLLLVGVLLGSRPMWGQQSTLLDQSQQASVQQVVEQQMKHLSVEQQIGQLIMPIFDPVYTPKQVASYKRIIENCHLGGILFQAGRSYDQYRLTQELQKTSPIPLLIALDGEWGLAMRLRDAIRYPRMMALGKLSNQELYNYGRHVAEQCRVMGIHINFSPVLDVNNNPRNPVIGTRSLGAQVNKVTQLGLAYAQGLEDGGILSVAKHFPGHGNTESDSHYTLPVIKSSLSSLERVELAPFIAYKKAGLGGIMTAHLQVPALDPTIGHPSSLSKAVVTNLLRNKIGFSGLVFTDALAMKGAKSRSTLPISVQAFLAGNDILLGPVDVQKTYAELVAAYKEGTITKAQIAEKCRRVLAYKVVLCGTLDSQKYVSKTYPSEKALHAALMPERIQKEAHTLWLKSIEFIGNKGHKLLPLALPNANTRYGVLEISSTNQQPMHFTQALRQLGAKQVSTTHLSSKSTAAQLAQAKQQMMGTEIVFVNVNSLRTGYAQALVEQLCKTNKQVVVTLFCSPLQSQKWQSVAKRANVALMAYEDTKEAKEAACSLLFGAAWQTTTDAPSINAPEDPTLHLAQQVAQSEGQAIQQRPKTVSKLGLEEIDKIVEKAINDQAFPGCQVVAIHKGKTIYAKAFGRQTYSSQSPAITLETIYDVASITKILATTPAVMQLVEKGKINLHAPIKQYLPEFFGHAVGEIKVAELLLHESGLHPVINFYLSLLLPKNENEKLLSYNRKNHWAPLGGGAYGNPNTVWNEQWISQQKKKHFHTPLGPNLFLNDHFYHQIVRQIKESPLYMTKASRYSDVGFLLLGKIVEAVSEESLDHYVDQYLYRPMKLKKTGYLPLKHFSPKQIAPTQNDQFIRKALLQGFVEDETAACMGGVCGNAGIFSTASEVAALGTLFLQKGHYHKKQLIKTQTVDIFLNTKGIGNKRALGFMINYPGNSNISEQASMQTFGHIGYTGTALWIDPAHDLVFVFLSNRTHPDRTHTKLMRDAIRQRTMGVIYDYIKN